MTRVAPLTAITAVSWDAALEETLSGATGRSLASAGSGSVHSVHRRAANLSLGDHLLAVVSADIDDAPWTLRLDPEDWSRLHVHAGDVVRTDSDGVRITTAERQWLIRRDAGGRWAPDPVDLGRLETSDLSAAHGLLSGFTHSGPQTPFGRAAQSIVDDAVDRLSHAVDSHRSPADAAHVSAAASRLIGLGEGLTPSGDDIVTGLAFLAAHPGMRLNRIVPALARTVREASARTTELSLVTMRAALEGRGRQSMHDLARALATGDSAALADSARRILAIGHSSGADILTGLRLALELEAREREASPARRPHPGTASRPGVLEFTAGCPGHLASERFIATKEITR